MNNIIFNSFCLEYYNFHKKRFFFYPLKLFEYSEKKNKTYTMNNPFGCRLSTEITSSSMIM